LGERNPRRDNVARAALHNSAVSERGGASPCMLPIAPVSTVD
jgi:hypothetical protein